MKKIIISTLILTFSLTLLSGCEERKDASDWLQGKWYSKEWNTTYTFSENDNIWKIKSDTNEKIARCSREFSNENNKNEIELINKKGTEFHIIPIDKTHIKFQQISEKGTLGTTNAVMFIKK